jgi:hypothetical protein
MSKGLGLVLKRNRQVIMTALSIGEPYTMITHRILSCDLAKQ